MKDGKSRILLLLMDPRQPDENNRAYAYRILRKNIMNIQLQPGCQLSEAELSEHLVMSRTPIHEALMMLKGEWLVDVLPQRSSIVSKDFDALQEYNSPAVPSEMMEKLEALDVETLTPIEALNFLYELKKTLKGSLNS